MLDILGLGGVAVDDLVFVDGFPPPDAKTVVTRRERACGGLTATALVAGSSSRRWWRSARPGWRSQAAAGACRHGSTWKRWAA